MTAGTTTATLETLLSQYEDQQTREAILRVVNQTGVQPDDPLFMLMVATGQLQGIVRQAPQNFKQTFEQAHQDILRKLDGYEQAARRGVEQQVAEAAKEAIAKAGKSKTQLGVMAIAAGAVVVLAAMGVGAVLGYGWFRSSVSFASGDPTRLTVEQADALRWAQSPEGQYARDLMDWNESLLGGECQQQVEGFVEDEGLTIQIGTKTARSGFCLVWIEPPSEREFF